MSSVAFCKGELKMEQNAMVNWSSYIREVYVWKLANNQNKEIGGPSLIFEIDESLFVHKKNNVEHHSNGTCRETNTCCIMSVPNRLEKTLLSIIKNI